MFAGLDIGVTSFLDKITEFPISTDEPDWFNKVQRVFNEYGTHIISSADLGAMYTYESQFSQKSYDELRAAGVDISTAASVSAEFHRTNGASAESEIEEETEMRIMYDGSAQAQRSITLGGPLSSSIPFAEWANEIENPVPITFDLSPISELLTAEYFPNDPQIESKRAVMEAGYELYCDSMPNCQEHEQL